MFVEAAAGVFSAWAVVCLYLAWYRRWEKARVPFTSDLSGRVCLITGANIGIGLETAKAMAAMGAHVVMACRDLKKANAAAELVRANAKNSGRVEVMELDLSSLASVRDFAANFKKRNLPLHYLINNAGMFTEGIHKTQDGYEQQFQVNHLGHFLLTKLLLDTIVSSAPARIVVVSSRSHFAAKGVDFKMFTDPCDKGKMNFMYYYEISKLCNVLFANELQRNLQARGVKNVTVNSLHPGSLVFTNVTSNSSPLIQVLVKFIHKLGFTKTAAEGAYTTLYAALAPEFQTKGGLYLTDCSVVKPSAQALGEQLAKKLWLVSEEMTAKYC